ncbi:hypothetical protein [Roseicyclus persicicus]|nr:hypothetical protein [Roseibacterium persicicum]
MPMRGSRRLVESCTPFKIKDVVAAGLHDGSGALCLEKGPAGLDFSVVIEGHGTYLDLTLYTGWGDERQRIELSKTPAHFGGSRYWLHCPRCSARGAVLYLVKSFACRKCHELRYTAQFESPRERMRRRLLKIRELIGSDLVIENPLNPPPKGMSVRKWERLLDEYEEVLEAYRRELRQTRAWRNDAPSTRRSPANQAVHPEGRMGP